MVLVYAAPKLRADGKAGMDSGLDSGLDWTLDWTGLDWFFQGGGIFFRVGGVVLFFLVCKNITFLTFPQQAIFFPLGEGGGV